MSIPSKMFYRMFIVFVVISLVFLLTGCPSRIQNRQKKSVSSVPPPSPYPVVRSELKGHSLLLFVSNTSGRTFYRVRIVVSGEQCQGRLPFRRWVKLTSHPLYHGDIRRFHWKIPVLCKKVNVQAFAVPRPGLLSLKILEYVHPYVRFVISNTSDKVILGLLVRISGTQCRTPTKRMSFRFVRKRRLYPNHFVRYRVRLKIYCRYLKIRAIPVTRELLLRYRRYKQHLRRRQQQDLSPQKSPGVKQPPKNQKVLPRKIPPSHYSDEVYFRLFHRVGDSIVISDDVIGIIFWILGKFAKSFT